ncbi:MAG: alanine:cation symporter family protein [Oscillospiraceae bacterium]|nr:alanine:cation symporter family protein [Oscillospiraceae bacterium]
MLELLIQALWIVASIMIFMGGIYFSFKLRFLHLNFVKMWKAISKKPNKKDSISAFQSLTMSLAGRIGVGSLSGIALAIYLGGPGVLFWIWMTSILCAIMAFAESVLAVVFRRKDSGNIYRGGPFYYIKDGMGNKKLAVIYAAIIIVSFIGGFLTVQVNTVSRSINDIANINPIIIGVTIAAITGVTIFGGVKKIANVTEKLIPIVTFFYLAVCAYIIFSNIPMIRPVFNLVLDSAFNFRSFGAGVISTLLIGMQKGIFSSEVGLGTGSIAAATADTETAVDNGFVQVFGIHIENILFATITTFVVCMSSYASLVIGDPNGIEITLYAFKYHIGAIGPILITITITLFALATVLAGYYYGESSLKFIKKTSKADIMILKLITMISIVIGSVMSSSVIWTLVNVLVGILAIINTYALFKLKDIVIDEYNATR